MGEQELSDEDLLNLYFSGDAQAFQIFFQRHKGRVYGYARRKGLDESSAQDVSQEAFLRLHRSIHHYESGRAALPWFFTIVHHCVVDAIRKLRKMAIVGLDENKFAYEPREDEGEAEENLQALLEGLSSEQRQLMLMRAVDDMSFKEIAELTGKKDFSLRKLYERTRVQIRKRLEKRKSIL